ncbi:MAG: dihydrodipicolinate synthase family protein [Deinococcales bacterium]
MNQGKFALGGIIPPLPTPFNAQGGLDLDALAKSIEILSPKVDGFLILGSNGEAAYLSEAERREVLLRARSAIPKDKIMIAGTGGESSQLVKERNEEVAEIGADCVLVLAPNYYKGLMSDELLYQHYALLAEASPLPLYLYNVPANTTIALSPSLIARLAKLDNVYGLKDSSGDIFKLTEIMRQVPEDFQLMTGNAPTLLPALSLGARGGILAVGNVAPKIYKAIIEHFQAGEMTEARRLQLAYNPIALAVTSLYGVPALKAALRLQGVPAGYPRMPLRDVGGEVLEHLKTLIQNCH